MTTSGTYLTTFKSENKSRMVLSDFLWFIVFIQINGTFISTCRWWGLWLELNYENSSSVVRSFKAIWNVNKCCLIVFNIFNIIIDVLWIEGPILITFRYTFSIDKPRNIRESHILLGMRSFKDQIMSFLTGCINTCLKSFWTYIFAELWTVEISVWNMIEILSELKSCFDNIPLRFLKNWSTFSLLHAVFL